MWSSVVAASDMYISSVTCCSDPDMYTSPTTSRFADKFSDHGCHTSLVELPQFADSFKDQLELI